MPGFTRAQLIEKAVDIKQYAWCRRCRLYWSRRRFAKHRHASQAGELVKIDIPLIQRPRKNEVAIINPAYERFIGALVELVVKDLVTHPSAEEADTKTRSRRSTKSAYQHKVEYDVLTIGEAFNGLA